MRFIPSSLEGLFLVELEAIEDDRGFFARSYCHQEFDRAGLDPCAAQCNISFNRKRGTIRGMHWAAHPHAEAKLVRCTAGAILDVVVDIRRSSPTFGEWAGFELSQSNRNALYVPVGFAHGFQTLTDSCEVFYQMSAVFAPQAARGARWNDPAFGIQWPIGEIVISHRDQGFPDFRTGDGF
jgi:dTDP-4-dehydrorhamnose 3,5-epimerase